MEWDVTWFLLQEDLTEEEDTGFLGDSPSLGEHKENEFPEEIPILPLRDNVLFPEIALPWVITEEPWVRLINDVVLDKKILGVVPLRGEVKGEKLTPEDFYDIGVIGKISRLIKLPDNAVQVLIFGLVKFRIREWVRWEPYPVAKIEILKEEETHSDEIEALVRNVVSLFQQVVELAPYLPREAFVTALNIKKPSRLANFIASNLNLDVESKIELLSSPDLSTKLTRLSFYLTRE
ncbi:MAG TPA: LON peptidase substrate-binding domain-containing protein, partial [Candidatus Atribacteria bacterium]|nr:LON peptidase substrate-binding domain-containing protein [Candidatus Atribacteria bacterium]